MDLKVINMVSIKERLQNIYKAHEQRMVEKRAIIKEEKEVYEKAKKAQSLIEAATKKGVKESYAKAKKAQVLANVAKKTEKSLEERKKRLEKATEAGKAAAKPLGERAKALIKAEATPERKEKAKKALSEVGAFLRAHVSVDQPKVSKRPKQRKLKPKRMTRRKSSATSRRYGQ